jgi:hypothetical protein
MVKKAKKAERKRMKELMEEAPAEDEASSISNTVADNFALPASRKITFDTQLDQITASTSLSSVVLEYEIPISSKTALTGHTKV